MSVIRHWVVAVLMFAVAGQAIAADESAWRSDALAALKTWQSVLVDVKRRKLPSAEFASRLSDVASMSVAGRAMASALLGSRWTVLDDQDKDALGKLSERLFVRTVVSALRGDLDAATEPTGAQLRFFASKGPFLDLACEELPAIPCGGFEAPTSWKSASGDSLGIEYFIILSDKDARWYIVEARINGMAFLPSYSPQVRAAYRAGGIVKVKEVLNGFLARPWN